MRHYWWLGGCGSRCVAQLNRRGTSVRFVMKFRTLPPSIQRQHKANPQKTDATSITVNRTLPTRLPNSAYRVREYLTEKEVDRLIEAARKRGRNSQRDVAAILLAYRHGLRASELCSLKWSQIDLRNGRLHVNRAKGGMESVHPICGPELRVLRPLQGQSPYVFTTEAGTPVTTVVSCPALHLLLCAKHLFVAAIMVETPN
jgi:integrase